MLALTALGAMELGAFGARDVVVTGRGAPGEKPYAVKFGRLTLDKIAGGKAREASIEDFALDSADGGHVALRRLSLRGLDFNALLAPGEARTSRLDRAEAEGVVPDLPDAGPDGRVKFEIGALGADFANYREGVPTKFAARLDRLKADLAARGESPAAHSFTALGYRDIALSGEIAGVWREEARAFEIEGARVDAKDMGAVTLQAAFGNVGASVFSPSPIVARAAMLTATVTRLEATVEGGGLIERMLAQDAKSSGGDVAKLRADYARDAGAVINASLEDSEKARRIGEAVTKFLNHPTRLRIKLTSPKGVGALDLGLKRPGEILNELEVEAEARCELANAYFPGCSAFPPPVSGLASTFGSPAAAGAPLPGCCFPFIFFLGSGARFDVFSRRGRFAHARRQRFLHQHMARIPPSVIQTRFVLVSCRNSRHGTIRDGAIFTFAKILPKSRRDNRPRPRHICHPAPLHCSVAAVIRPCKRGPL